MKFVSIALSAALIIGFAGGALAEDVYGDEDGCRRATGEGALGDDLTILREDSIEFFESGCSIDSYETIEDKAILSASCSGEGENWKEAYEVEALPDEDGFLIWSADTPQYRTEVRRCQ